MNTSKNCGYCRQTETLTSVFDEGEDIPICDQCYEELFSDKAIQGVSLAEVAEIVTLSKG